MKIALIDNGSLAPAAHELLRATAAALARQLPPEATAIAAVSWKHSDRVRLPDGARPFTLQTWVRAQCAAGEREFIFLPFFVSPQGAIGGALQRDLEALQAELGFTFRFTPGLSPDVLASILHDRVVEAKPDADTAVLVVDHGGPSPLSAAIRNEAAALLRGRLGNTVESVTAASMESPDDRAEGEFAFNAPLFAAALEAQPSGRPILVAPLFLAPGRHAGPEGDLATLAAAHSRGPWRFTALIGDHPLVAATLSRALLPFVPVPA